MIYVRIWSGSGNGHIVDMTHAGKRGKRCRKLTFLGDAARVIDFLCTTPEQRAARGDCYALECRPVHETRPDDFDAVCEAIRAVAVPETRLFEEEIRGIDAPRPTLTAGVPGLWSADADESGVSLQELNDPNQWTEITGSRQTPAKAYELARKVWPAVERAKTRKEASDILHAAGVRLHGYCAMD